MIVKWPAKPAPVTDCAVLVSEMVWFVKAVESAWRRFTLATTTLTANVPLSSVT